MSAAEVAPAYVGEAIEVADTSEMSRSDWLAMRRRGIGGSDAAAICGQDRYRSPFMVWLDKVDGAGDDTASEAAEHGRDLEPYVREKVAARSGIAIAPHPVLLAHGVRTWQLANVDGLVASDLGPGVYEGKTAGWWTSQLWADGAVPPAYLLQGMHYLAVTGFDWLLFGVFIAGQRIEHRIVQRDQDLIDHLNAIEADFWQRVVELAPPEPDGSKATTDFLSHLYDVAPGSVVTLSEADEVVELLDARARAAEGAKAFEEAKNEAENKLKVLLGSGEVAVDSDGVVLFTWKAHEVRRFSIKEHGAERPDCHEAHSSTTVQRRFHVPTRKES